MQVTPRPLALIALVAAALPATQARAQQSAAIDLAGVQIRNATNQSRTSPGTITPAYRYHYVVDGSVRGVGGVLGILYPNPTPLAQVMETLAPGSSAALSGDGDNCSGQHPFALPPTPTSGSTTILGIDVDYALTLAVGIDAAGHAYFSITNVVLSPAALTGYVQFSTGTATISRIDTCPANCDGSTAPPILNVLDFNCFLNQFAAGAPAANCDCSTAAPVLNVLDFNCFVNRFAAGCP
jgi:hypothetical protein